MITVNCDGGARGNPGPAACACVFTKEGSVIFKVTEYLGSATNNFAEYSGVVLALESAVKKGVREDLEFVLDSQLVVNQLAGKFKIKNEVLKKMYIRVKDLEKKLGTKINYTSVPREKNKIADFLVNKVLDENL